MCVCVLERARRIGGHCSEGKLTDNVGGGRLGWRKDCWEWRGGSSCLIWAAYWLAGGTDQYLDAVQKVCVCAKSDFHSVCRSTRVGGQENGATGKCCSTLEGCYGCVEAELRRGGPSRRSGEREGDGGGGRGTGTGGVEEGGVGEKKESVGEERACRRKQLEGRD